MAGIMREVNEKRKALSQRKAKNEKRKTAEGVRSEKRKAKSAKRQSRLQV